MKDHAPELDEKALPSQIMGYVSVRSQGGVSIASASHVDLQPRQIHKFHGAGDDLKQARRTVEMAGLKIISESRLGFAVSGPPEAFEELSGGTVENKRISLVSPAANKKYSSRIDIVGPGQPETCGLGTIKSAKSGLEAVILETPKRHHGQVASPVPPKIGKYHLELPGDIASLLGADAAHAAGYTGKGITVAMVDTGHFAHPFFHKHRYHVRHPIVVVEGTDAKDDPVGHGTGESANIFAISPRVTLAPIRATDQAGRLVGTFAGWLAAKSLRPAIITSSWGADGQFPPKAPPEPADVALLAEIMDAIRDNICVIFSSGNGEFYVAPQSPYVIAAGGVTYTDKKTYEASNFASAYQSPWYPSRIVPDVCGIIGSQPRAQYLMLPVPPGCPLDNVMSRPSPEDPSADGTTSSDGWALFSGTSAAAPQIAGIAALMLEAKPHLVPSQIAEALRTTARDIDKGSCHRRFGNSALKGPDAASGYGLASAFDAVRFALEHF